VLAVFIGGETLFRLESKSKQLEVLKKIKFFLSQSSQALIKSIGFEQ
jgi:hypothetical protein